MTRQVQKILATLMILTLILCNFPISVMAKESSYITVSNVSGKVGETVTIEVKTKQELTVDDLMVEVSYDSKKLSTENEKIIVNKDLKNADSGIARAGLITMGSYDSSTYTIASGTTILTIQFQILEAGENTIEVALDSENSEKSENYSETITAVVKGEQPPVAVTGISLNKEKLTINSGNTEQLVANVLPAEATNKNVKWSSSKTEIATVSDQGVVKGIKEGTAVITAKTEDGNYSKTCNVTVVCSHINVTNFEEQESTCKEQGHKAYTKCNDCGKIISGDDSLLPLADHNYGEIIPAQEPTHTSEDLVNGVKAHYKCSVCGKLFIDENGTKKEVTEKDLEIKAEHSYANEWKTSEEKHWKECGCGNIINLENHKGGTATCTKKAVCEVCGKEYGEVNSENHQHTEIRNAVESTTRQKGYSGDVYCLDCNKLVRNGTELPLKEPEIKVTPKEEKEEDQSAVNAVKEILKDVANDNADEEMPEELKEKIKEAVLDEKQIKVNVVSEEVKEENVEKDANIIRQNTPSNLNIIGFYNIEVLIEIDGKEEGKITKLKSAIPLTMPIPTDLPAVPEGYERLFSIIKIHNGVVSVLPTNLVGNTAVSSSNEFSTYALSYTDVEKTEPEEQKENTQNIQNTTNDETNNILQENKTNTNTSITSKIKNPTTGDNILIWIGAAIISGLGVIIIKWKTKGTGKQIK